VLGRAGVALLVLGWVHSDDPGPDLLPTFAGRVPTVVKIGKKGRLSIRVTNTGSVALFAQATLNVYVSTQPNFDGQALWMAGAQKVLKIKPGASRTVKLKTTWPLIGEGPHYLFAQATAPGMIGAGVPVPLGLPMQFVVA
jgi:hypothetical protein